MNTEQIFQERIMGIYPQGVFFDSVKTENNNKVASLSSVIPKVIFDDKHDKRVVKFLKINDIGKITIDRENKFVFETKPEQIRERINQSLIDIQMRSEQIVLSVVYDRLVKIAMVRTTLNPIFNVLKAVYEKKLTKDSLLRYPKRERYERYIKFLCDLDILREQKDRYSEGNLFIQVEKALNNEDEEKVINRVFGLTIKEGKTYLLNNLNINVLKPFIRISNVYYSCSALFNKLLYIRKENLYSRYLNAYDINTNFVNFQSYLNQLNIAKILHEDDYVYGNKSVFEKINELILKKVPISH